MGGLAPTTFSPPPTGWDFSSCSLEGPESSATPRHGSSRAEGPVPEACGGASHLPSHGTRKMQNPTRVLLFLSPRTGRRPDALRAAPERSCSRVLWGRLCRAARNSPCSPEPVRGFVPHPFRSHHPFAQRRGGARASPSLTQRIRARGWLRAAVRRHRALPLHGSRCPGPWTNYKPSGHRRPFTLIRQRTLIAIKQDRGFPTISYLAFFKACPSFATGLFPLVRSCGKMDAGDGWPQMPCHLPQQSRILSPIHRLRSRQRACQPHFPPCPPRKKPPLQLLPRPLKPNSGTPPTRCAGRCHRPITCMSA